jgi:hypothetical protein
MERSLRFLNASSKLNRFNPQPYLADMLAPIAGLPSIRRAASPDSRPGNDYRSTLPAGDAPIAAVGATNVMPDQACKGGAGALRSIVRLSIDGRAGVSAAQGCVNGVPAS